MFGIGVGITEIDAERTSFEVANMQSSIMLLDVLSTYWTGIPVNRNPHDNSRIISQKIIPLNEKAHILTIT